MLGLWNLTWQVSGKGEVWFPLNTQFALWCNFFIWVHMSLGLGIWGGEGLKIIFVPLKNSKTGANEATLKGLSSVEKRLCHLLKYFLFVSWVSKRWIWLKSANHLNQPRITYVMYLGANKLSNACFMSLFSVSKHNFITFHLPMGYI